MKNDAVGYIRVSTMEQAQHGAGLETQEEAIREYATRNGLNVYAVYTDAGVSGAKDFTDREGFIKTLGAIQAGRADVLLVYKTDRLARDVVANEMIFREVARAGGRIVSVTEPMIDGEEETPERAMMRQLLAVFDEYERKRIRMRLMAGRAAAKARGQYIGGSVPYGYTRDGQRVTPDASEQETIRLMTYLRASGLSYNHIAKELNRRGVPSRGRAWDMKSVWRIIKATAA